MESGKKANWKKILLLFIAIILLLCGFFSGIFIKQKKYNNIINNVDSRSLLQDLINNDICYVIGHKSPDTDTVCSAILLSDYLNLYGINCEARVSGKLNNETKFVLDNFNIVRPKILDDASNKKIILIDHSEYSQSIDGMKDAEIVGIFDHHGIGNVVTNGPIVSNTMNVGSTATIIYSMYKLNDLKIDKKTAYLISACILSDTLNLAGVTTTDIDRYALKECVKIAGITNVEEFYNKMKEAALSYEGMSEKEIFLSDYKEYDMSGYKIGIACINSANKIDAEEKIISMKNVMKDIYDTQGMKHLFISVTNYADNESTFAGYGDGVDEVLEKAYGAVEVVFKPGVSRKKDIVPKLREIYEKIRKQ